MRGERKGDSRHLREPDQEQSSWEESILLQPGHEDSYFICHAAWRHSRHRAIQPCPVNLVIPRRAHAVPGVIQLGGAREVLSQEIPGSAEAARQEGVLRALVRSRLARRSTEWFGWKVMNTLCPAESTRPCPWLRRDQAGCVSAACLPHYPSSPWLWSGPLLSQTMWFLLVSWQPHAVSWIEQCMSLFPCLVILQLNNRHISVKACLLSWVLNHYSFRNTFQAFSF